MTGLWLWRGSLTMCEEFDSPTAWRTSKHIIVATRYMLKVLGS